MSIGGMLRFAWKSAVSDPRMLKVGEAAPDFQTVDHRGNSVRLSDYRGKRVVLWFYPMADTPGCTKEGCSFRDLKSEYDRKNVQLLGVSFDEPEKNARFAAKFGFQFPLLSDPDRKIGIAYGAADSPADELARRIAYVIGEDGRIVEAHPKVAAASYPAEQLAAL